MFLDWKLEFIGEFLIFVFWFNFEEGYCLGDGFRWWMLRGGCYLVYFRSKEKGIGEEIVVFLWIIIIGVR